jgi:hypothetical protein
MAGKDERRIDAQLETAIRRVMVRDPAGAPEQIIEWIVKAYDQKTSEDAWHFLKGSFMVEAALALLAAALLGAVIGHWVWR